MKKAAARRELLCGSLLHFEFLFTPVGTIKEGGASVEFHLLFGL